MLRESMAEVEESALFLVDHTSAERRGELYAVAFGALCSALEALGLAQPAAEAWAVRLEQAARNGRMRAIAA